MRFSFSSLLMTLIAASVLILLLHLILTGKKHYRLFRTDFLGILMIAVLLRILFPVEFFFTISIYSEHVMTAVRDFLLSPGPIASPVGMRIRDRRSALCIGALADIAIHKGIKAQFYLYIG